MFPDAILCGCPYDVFWYHDPREFWSYVNAFQSKQKVEAKQKNAFAWLQGEYIAKAIGAVLPNGDAYPKRPYSFKDDKQESIPDNAENAAEDTTDTNRDMIDAQLIRAGSIIKEKKGNAKNN